MATQNSNKLTSGISQSGVRFHLKFASLRLPYQTMYQSQHPANDVTITSSHTNQNLRPCNLFNHIFTKFYTFTINPAEYDTALSLKQSNVTNNKIPQNSWNYFGLKTNIFTTPKSHHH